jgi:polyisoprenoid-binding protein YceI
MHTLILLCLSSLSFGQRFQYTNSSSNIQLKMDASLHEINGKAQKFQGHFDIGKEKSTGELKIQADSLTTFLGVRDEKMHESVLQVTNFPNIVFNIHSIEGIGKNPLTDEKPQIHVQSGSGEIKIHGSLTVSRVSQEVSIPAAYRWEDGSLRIIGSTTIKWTDFNLPDPSIIISTLYPPVDIKFSLYASPSP